MTEMESAGASSACGLKPLGNNQLLLIAARDNTESFISSRRNDVLLTMVLGVVATAFWGYLIVMHGLRPIRAVARAA